MASGTAEALLADEGWVRRHSRWRFWTWTLGFFGWVAFMYAGYKARRPQWVLFGVAYAVPFIFAMAFADDRGGDVGKFLDDQVMPFLVIVIGVVGIFHVRRLLPEYLAIRARQEAEEGSDDAATQARRFLRSPGAPAVAPGVAAHPVVAAAQADAGAALAQEPALAPEAEAAPVAAVLDVNTASEAELAALPGVGAVLARRAVGERQRNGPFASVDAFAELLELRPHMLERLRPRLRAEAPPSPSGPRGRVVDF